MNKQELLYAGVFIYACEGTKLRKDPRGKNTFIYAIEVTNSNPFIIAIFMRFLREILKVDEKRIRCELFTYDRDQQFKLKQFWSKVTKVSPAQFQKTILLTPKGSKYKPNPLGTLKIRYSSKETFLFLQSRINKILRRGARAVEQAALEMP